MSVNKLIIIGRVGKDSEMRQIASGGVVTSFSVATSEKFKDKEETTWHKVVVFGKLGEICGQYVKKGMQVYVEGKVSNRTYKNKEGKDVYLSEVVGNVVQFLGGKSSESSSEVSSEISNPVSVLEQQGSGSLADDFIPF